MSALQAYRCIGQILPLAKFLLELWNACSLPLRLGRSSFVVQALISLLARPKPLDASLCSVDARALSWAYVGLPGIVCIKERVSVLAQKHCLTVTGKFSCAFIIHGKYISLFGSVSQPFLRCQDGIAANGTYRGGEPDQAITGSMHLNWTWPVFFEGCCVSS